MLARDGRLLVGRLIVVLPEAVAAILRHCRERTDREVAATAVTIRNLFIIYISKVLNTYIIIHSHMAQRAHDMRPRGHHHYYFGAKLPSFQQSANNIPRFFGQPEINA